MNRKKGLLLYTIIGDALGTSFDGFSRGHMQANFKNLNNYADPYASIKKGNIEKWKMPCLYSSISQFLIILGMHISEKKFDLNNFISCIIHSPEINEYNYGIFRNPGEIEKNFILRIKNNKNEIPSFPCTRLVPISAPFSFQNLTKEQHVKHIASLITNFNLDNISLAGSLSFSLLLNYLIVHEVESANSLINSAIIINKEIINEINANSNKIFELRINPDSLIESFNMYNNILGEVIDIEDKDSAEKIIYTSVNKIQKSHYTRATVNDPLCIIPYIIYLNQFYSSNPSDIIFNIVKEGGTTATTAALTGAIIGSIYGTKLIPEQLIENLINKKRILTIIDLIADNRLSSNIIEEFMQSEARLTIKEQEELKAKLKHYKPKTKKVKTEKDKINELSRHVVESWTKLDKAKWKKERKKLNK